jgi:hypothetical protein
LRHNARIVNLNADVKHQRLCFRKEIARKHGSV